MPVSSSSAEPGRNAEPETERIGAGQLAALRNQGPTVEMLAAEFLKRYVTLRTQATGGRRADHRARHPQALAPATCAHDHPP